MSHHPVPPTLGGTFVGRGADVARPLHQHKMHIAHELPAPCLEVHRPAPKHSSCPIHQAFSTLLAAGYTTALGRHRWVVEHIISWVLRFKRLGLRYDRTTTT